MPDRQYLARHEPPTVADRALVHALELVIAVGSAVLGAGLVVDAFHPGWDASVSIQMLPPWMTLGVGLWVVLGAGAVVFSVLWPGGSSAPATPEAPRPPPARQTKLGRKWVTERVGWVLLSTGWACYSVAVMGVYPHSLIGWGLPGLVALGGVARIGVLLVLEFSTRKNIRRWRITRRARQTKKGPGDG